MSHIDSFRHEIVGLLGGLPVYHPLEAIRGDFSCDPSQLLLGGGSGEHPAMVLKNPTAAVACFLDAELRAGANRDTFPLRRHIDEWTPIVNEYLDYDYDNVLEFFGWSIETYAQFHALCRSDALPNPCGEDMSVEEWLVLGFGEFVYFAMPELASELIARLREPYAHFHHVRYSSILLIPPNMPVYANGGNAFLSKRKA